MDAGIKSKIPIRKSFYIVRFVDLIPVKKIAFRMARSRDKMLGIKLLDQIHVLWNQLLKIEDHLKNRSLTGSERDQIYNLKTQINLKFAILDEYHKIDGLMNYSEDDLKIGDESK
jgi:hypothetical protein